ncbi:MAG: pyrroline-5-carboxylate reductase [Chloroflexota bacterium]
MSEQWRLVFLGGGQMAEAIARGTIGAGLLTADRIAASEVRADRRAYLESKVGIRAVATNAEAVTLGDVILLAVKPQDTGVVLSEIGGLVREDQLVVSIAAGVPLSKLEAPFAPRKIPVIRVMPNTPCLVGQGMAAVARGTYAAPEDAARVLSIFNATGKAVSLPEKDLDAVTGLSGSGPGYVGVIVEALIDGGVRAGLARDVATTLAIQTVLGSAQMLAETGTHPAVLKDMVTSPGGTTIAGIHAMERGGVRSALIDAVVAATERSRELGS